MTTMHLDTSRFEAEVRKIQARYGTASGEAVTLVADRVVDRLERTWPRDTNRSVRGWIMAANEAGLTPRPLPATRKSSRSELYLEALSRQVAIAERAVARWERFRLHYRRNRRTLEPYFAVIERRLAEAEKHLARAARELQRAQGDEATIFFDRGGYVYGQARYKKNSDFQQLSTVRHKIYGGAGRRFTVGDRAFVELINREPHARIVERVARHGHPLRSAMAAVGNLGLRRASNRFIAALETTMARVAG